jgi:hypothetical protein
MFKSYFLSRDPEKVNQYKRYNNKLNKLKELAKKNYFIAQFNLYKQNTKATWGLIGMLINMKKKSTIFTNKLFYKNRCYTAKQDICDKLNSHFINVCPDFAAQIPDCNDKNPVQFIRR